MELISLPPSYSASTSSILSFKLSSKPENINLPYVECQGVRITPHQMIFDNAIEGKSFYEKFTIQNTQNTAVFIRVLPANSYAFRVKAIPRGIKLSPGLSLDRYISYQCLRATSVCNAFVPIYINDERIEYKVLVILSCTDIKVEPTLLNFGPINARTNAVVRMLSIRNDGSKGSRFTIDLGRNDMELLVEPAKGIMQPKSVTNFKVECLGTSEGPFLKEFWIKSESLLRIGVTGEIIYPELVPIHANATSDFTLIDFPKTYVGTTYSKTFVLRNHSSMHSTFCTLFENAKDLLDYREGLKIDLKASNFKMISNEGIMEPFEARIFKFVFIPKINDKFGKQNRHNLISFCCLRITRIPFSSLPELDKSEFQYITDEGSVLEHYDDTASITSGLYSLGDSNFSEKSNISKYQMASTKFRAHNTRVVLFGEAEIPSVTIRPDSLNLGSMKTNKGMCREILLTNHSISLPIIFEYVKSCYVSVEPCTGTIEANGKTELAVTVTPSALGKFSIKIKFDLFYYNHPKDNQRYIKIATASIPITFEVHLNPGHTKPKFAMGITPIYIKEVGFFTDDIRFNSKIDMPRATLMKDVKQRIYKYDNDLIAFPNDRPKSLRPWASKNKCRTICANIYRYENHELDVRYQLTEKEWQVRNRAREIVQDMINFQIKCRKIKADELKTFVHYEMDNPKELLLANFPKMKCPQLKQFGNDSLTSFLPLMPSQLNKVTVYPSYIDLGKMAPKTIKSNTITIYNKSNYSIVVLMKSRKPNISFRNNQYLAVHSMKKKVVEFTFHASPIIGHYYSIIDCIINCSDTFIVPVSVEVAPKSVKFPFEDVILTDADYKFISVTNPVNVPIEFSWKIPDSCFTVDPEYGTIPSYSSLMCFIKYTPHQNLAYNIDATLCSPNGIKQIVNIKKVKTDPHVILKNPKLEFRNIPVNMKRKLSTTIENLLSEALTFVVENPEPIPGIIITPTEGLIRGFDQQAVDISVQFATCLSFQCVVTINVQNRVKLELTLIGTVIYPLIEFKPEMIKLKKIVTNAFERQVFLVMNKSKSEVVIDFLLDDYPEYRILTSRSVEYGSESLKRVELEVNGQKELYLFFNPMGAGLFTFYLPYVVNEVFGPPVLYCSETLTPSTYTTVENSKYDTYDKVNITKLPKLLPLITVNSSVGSDILKFSKLNFDFKLKNREQYHSGTNGDLTIWNASQNSCRFCIRTDTLKYPFALQFVSGRCVEFLEYSIVGTLEPKEEILFKIIFEPSSQGSYFIQMPIYLRHYLDGNIFNYLTLSGVYPSPKMYTKEKELYFEPIPIKCETEKKIVLNLENHGDDCNIEVEIEDKFVEVELFDRSGSYELGIVIAIIKYFSKYAMTVNSNINFYCSCGANCRLDIKGCIENCSVTIHAVVARLSANESSQETKILTMQDESISSLLTTSEPLSNHNSTCFPYFPTSEDCSEYANHMRNIVTTLEEFIGHQGFYGKRCFKIPNDFNIQDCSQSDGNEPKKQKSCLPKYVELLINLIGPTVTDYINTKDIPTGNLDKINCIYNMYVQVIHLISSQGGYLSHIYPENLLSYDDYVLFLKYIYQNKPEFIGEAPPDILQEDKFYLLSKQQWIDLLLQTYKVSVLNRVSVPFNYKKDSLPSQNFTYRSQCSSLTEKPIIIPDVGPFQSASTFSQMSKTKEHQSTSLCVPLDESEFWISYDQATSSAFYSTSELILLHWLQYYTNEQIKKWLKNINLYNVPTLRNVQNFDFDLQDGVVFIAVTLQYCSYLEPHCRDIFYAPSCYEQKFHNALKIIQAWNMIGLSYYVTPTQIIKPNCLNMVMLVNYLYQVLPTFCANNELVFKSGLSTKCSKQILIQNISENTIGYNVIILENERKVFFVKNNKFEISKSKEIILPICFYAKFMNEETAIIIINGEYSGKPYAKSMAFKLVGQSIASYSTSRINISLSLYETKDVELNIQSPYTDSAKYELYYSVIEPDFNTILPTSSTMHSIVPRRICFFNESTEFDNMGVGTLQIMLCPLTTNEKTVWIIFRNQTVGDFTIEIVTTTNLSPKLYVDIEVPVFSDFANLKCICRNKDLSLSTNCPRRIIIKVPNRNERLLSGCAELTLKMVQEEDLKFWNKYIGTRTGLQIKKWITKLEPRYEDYYDIVHVFESTVKYMVEIEKYSPHILIPEIVLIEDVFSNDFYDLHMHINEEQAEPKRLLLKMTSLSGYEYRCYNIVFVSKK
ncbi:hypothetical protein FQR65_LT01205 [Abscondita terminalis]|nr:hypothetical protein FQR65_LT01205 [Abscondita terminalis]